MNDIFGANRLRQCNSVPQERSVIAPAAPLICQSSQPDTFTTLATFQEQSEHSRGFRNPKKDKAAASTRDESRLAVIRKGPRGATTCKLQ
jgi:hypothetical protein